MCYSFIVCSIMSSFTALVISGLNQILSCIPLTINSPCLSRHATQKSLHSNYTIVSTPLSLCLVVTQQSSGAHGAYWILKPIRFSAKAP